MSTRAHITIIGNEETLHMSHHCDGYPSGVGSDLVRLLKKFNKKNWEPREVRDYICEEDDEFHSVESGLRWDQEYLYVIDCRNHTLSGYYKGISNPGEDLSDYNDGYGDKLFIDDNIFDGRNVYSTEKNETKEKGDFWGIFKGAGYTPLGSPVARGYGKSVSIDWDNYYADLAKEVFHVMLDNMGDTEEVDTVIAHTLKVSDKFMSELKKHINE